MSHRPPMRGVGWRSRRHFRYARFLLLALMLACGQWLNIAHASRHPALSSVDKTCEFCLHAQGLGAGLVDLPKPPAPSSVHEAPRPLAAYFFPTSAPSYYPIRGPPTRAA